MEKPSPSKPSARIPSCCTAPGANARLPSQPNRKAAHEEIERIGYAALRKARSLTQAEIAEKLHISQPSVAALERRSDLMLSTLAKYVEALVPWSLIQP